MRSTWTTNNAVVRSKKWGGRRSSGRYGNEAFGGREKRKTEGQENRAKIKERGGEMVNIPERVKQNGERRAEA